MFFIYCLLLFSLNVSFGAVQEEQTIQIPTLGCPLTVKEIIQEEHLTEITVPLHKVSSQIVTKKKDIIGKQIRSTTLRPGAMIKVNDLKEPALVKKGEIVRIIYQTPRLKISNQGIAQKEGIKGETITIELPNSKRKIYGKISAVQEVRVDINC